MKARGVFLDTAANGFAWITTESQRRYLWLTLLLRLRYGFGRTGAKVLGPDQVIFQDFVRGSVLFHAGHDNWVGYHLLASDSASDAFLRALFAEPASRCTYVGKRGDEKAVVAASGKSAE